MTSTPGLKNLVLLGLGHAHVQVLRGLAHSRPADLNLTVIAPRPLAVYSGMVPGFVAGHYTAEQCRIPLDALLARSGARTIAGSAIGIDAETRTVSLASGEAVPWDWLSVNTGPIMDRDLLEVRMPGARRHALFVRPIDAFVQLWPQVAEMAASRPIHLAVVGAGAAGVELAMAASHALQGSGMPQGSHVSLVTGGEPPAAIYPQAVQARVQRALRRLNVTLIRTPPDLAVARRRLRLQDRPRRAERDPQGHGRDADPARTAGGHRDRRRRRGLPAQRRAGADRHHRLLHAHRRRPVRLRPHRRHQRHQRRLRDGRPADPGAGAGGHADQRAVHRHHRPHAGRRAPRCAARPASRSPAATPSIRSRPSTAWWRWAWCTPKRVKRNADARPATCWCWASRWAWA
jgi:hypothetical protein